MWCSTCQRDVPALGSPSGGAIRCTRCGSDLPAAQAESPASEPAPAESQPAKRESLTRAKLSAALRTSPLGDGDWQLEAELRGVRRLITALKSREPVATSARAVPMPHLPHARQLEPAETSINANGDAHPTVNTIAAPRSHSAGWLVLSLGLAVFSCGAVLLVWSLVGQRSDLWSIGMPLTLVGQAGLILGLVLHLDGLWNTSRKTAAVLSQLDGELKHVRQATTLLSSTHSTAGQSFYLHLAEGASPQLLLADLKGQMDLLSQQMARQKN